jgi:hypothetical protein
MIPVTCGLLAFMALQSPAERQPPNSFSRLFSRLRPALAAGGAAFAIGIWPYVPGRGHTLGSIEITDFLHGNRFLAGDTPWLKIFLNPVYMLASAVYNVTDIKAAYAPWGLIAAALLALALVFAGWLLTLPRDPRREEWLPLYALLPLAGGLFLHCIASAIAYRSLGTTPGHYFHIEAPVLALVFGAGLLNGARRRAGRLLGPVLLAFAAAGTVATMGLRLALFTGCAWLSDNFVNLHVDRGGDACRPDVMYDRLALLSWPAAGLPCMAAGFVLFATAALLALPQLGALRAAVPRRAAGARRKPR